MNDYSEMDNALRATVESTTIRFFAEHPELDPATTSLEYTPDGLTVTGYITGKWVISAEPADRIDLSTIPYDPPTNPYTKLFQEEGVQVHRTTQYQTHPDTDSQTPGKAAPAVPLRRETTIGSKCSPDCVRPTASQAHCSVCHSTFGGVVGFDKHRKNGFCLDPSEIGLTFSGKGIWRHPAPETSSWKTE